MQKHGLVSVSVVAFALVAALAGGQAAAAGSKPRHALRVRSDATWVVVPRGQPVQFAFTADTTQGSPFAEFSQSAENAIQMALEQHPTIRGFPIRVNDVETLCQGNNTQSAAAIVDNKQNTAVLGNLCSAGSVTALPIYQAAGLVTISGSASNSNLPTLAPTVFNRTIVVSDAVGDAGDLWAKQVAALPSVLNWDQNYVAEFGMTPVLAPFPALYFDAASLLLRRLQQVSRIINGNLVVNRAALATAVRDTSYYRGVTCTISLDPTTGNRINDPDTLRQCAKQCSTSTSPHEHDPAQHWSPEPHG
jgi:ABC-type branched-subunit amino acid transport system substrate-binding protein